MSLVARTAVPDYPFQIGEKMDFVVDPFWESHGTVRQVQMGVVKHFSDSLVLLLPMGEPRDDPRSTSKDLT